MKTTRTLLLASTMLVGSAIFSGSQAADNFNPVSELPGQARIQHSSARPAARAYYLLYAAALDQYAIDKAMLLSSEPVLAGMVEREFKNTLAGFKDYDAKFSRTNFSPVDDAVREANALQAFLSSGYHGRLQNEIQTYLAELRNSIKPK